MKAFVERMWRREAGAAGKALQAALAPAELLFRAGVRARDAAYAHELMPAARARVPVLSVGNIVVGGAGKTPLTAWLARRLVDAGHSPAVLHGGYAEDEPELHRAWNPEIPVYVGGDRVVSARAATEAGATVLLLDDGFQHRRLDREVDLVLVPAESWTNAPHLLPRGPWREPVGALQRASALVITHRASSPAQLQAARDGASAVAPHVPVIVVGLVADRWRAGADALEPTAAVASPPAQPVIAVTAIAQPTLFVENARSAGATVDELVAFPDHHAFDAADAAEIERRAAGRGVVTTAKDWVKLHALLPAAQVHVLEQRVVLEQGSDVLDALLARLVSRP